MPAATGLGLEQIRRAADCASIWIPVTRAASLRPRRHGDTVAVPVDRVGQPPAGASRQHPLLGTGGAPRARSPPHPGEATCAGGLPDPPSRAQQVAVGTPRLRGQPRRRGV